MATLKTKKASDSVSVLSKMQEYEICFSGFPKKGCQGSHISKLAPKNLARYTSFWSTLPSGSYAIVEIFGNLFWSKNEQCAVWSSKIIWIVHEQSLNTI